MSGSGISISRIPASASPESLKTGWFRESTDATGARLRKVMVVALARKLLIALWRFVTQGVVPEGAVMKPAG